MQLVKLGGREWRPNWKLDWIALVKTAAAFFGGILIGTRELIAVLIGFFLRRALGPA
jgi:hypothetical protein